MASIARTSSSCSGGANNPSRFAAFAAPAAETIVSSPPSSKWLQVLQQRRRSSSKRKAKDDDSGGSVDGHSSSTANNDPSASSSLRTESFQAITPQRFPRLASPDSKIVVVPHTLILGTHPSIASLQESEYFGHEQNAFWWIAGDCLGFRRGTGISPKTGKPYQLASALRYDASMILDYQEQTERLIAAGFLLWDVVGSCERVKAAATTAASGVHSKKQKPHSGKGRGMVKSSLDKDISNEVPNDIRGLITSTQYRTVRRIVFASGTESAKIFKKHNKEWLASGELAPGADDVSQRCFAKACRGGGNAKRGKDDDDHRGTRTIELIVAVSVSPAAAKLTYEQKRDWWEEHVYIPGLRSHAMLLESASYSNSSSSNDSMKAI